VPNSLSTQILPPCLSITLLQMASPIPVPSYSVRHAAAGIVRRSSRGILDRSHPVITDREDPGILLFCGTDMNNRGLFPMELDRVREQVLEDHSDLDEIPSDNREWIDCHGCTGIGYE